MNDNINTLIRLILIIVFIIMTIVFIYLYILVGNGNGIFEPIETILLILASLSFLAILITNFLFPSSQFIGEVSR